MAPFYTHSVNHSPVGSNMDYLEILRRVLEVLNEARHVRSFASAVKRSGWARDR